MADIDLIDRVRAGDDRAFEEIFRRHAGAVRRYARSCCLEADTADDLTAEVFARTLQAVRAGAGPTYAVRAYLLTVVRRVAAGWAQSAKREVLVEDFAAFAESAARPAGTAGDSEPAAEVRAMRAAERSLAVQAFRSLPERWQAVLWHTTVEEGAPRDVAPLLGLTANATAVLAHRAREGLRQAYLQAHVSNAQADGGDCARYADQLGVYTRGGLRTRAERGLRQHLDGCANCRTAALEVKDVNARLRALLPVAVIGWFATGYALKAAAAAAGMAAAAGAAAGAGTAATAGAAGTSGAAGAGAGGGGGAASGAGAAVSEGPGLPVKIGLAAGIAAAAAAALLVLAGGTGQPEKELRTLPTPAPSAPQKPPPGATEKPRPDPVPPSPEREATAATPGPASAAPKKPDSPAPEPVPPTSAAPTAGPTPTTAPPSPPPEPTPTPPPPPVFYQVNQLRYDLGSDGTEPEMRLTQSSLILQRSNLSVAGERYDHGVTVNARSSITIDLNRSCTAYEALVGVDDLSVLPTGVRYSVYGDGVRLWRSGVLHDGDRAVPVQVNLAGLDTVRLVAEPEQGSPVAPVDWASSRISCR